MPHIDIIGLGPGDPGQMTLKTLELLENGQLNYLRTSVHPTVEFLDGRKIEYTSFDHLYEVEEDFETVYEKISDLLIETAEKEERIIYGVPGNPLFGEETVVKLIQKAKDAKVSYTIHPGVSFVDVSMNGLEKDPIEGLTILDAFDLNALELDSKKSLLITQVYNRYMASEVKLELMKVFDAEKEVVLLINAGIPHEELIKRIALYELDRVDEINHLTSLYVPVQKDEYFGFRGIYEIVSRLLAEEGCPWDREQTHETLKRYLLEESYEVIEAIDRKDYSNLSEELGDVLFQIVFHALLGEKENFFTIQDVLKGINEKMIRRHPHVFMKQEKISSGEVETNWDAIKRQEKGIGEVYTQSQEMKEIPKSLPALMEAEKTQKKARKVGFDWKEPEDALEKLDEEINEFMAAVREKDCENMEEELGDLLFSVVNVARLYGISSELVLRSATKKFVERFERMEILACQEEKSMEECNFDEMNRLWEQSKTIIKSKSHKKSKKCL